MSDLGFLSYEEELDPVEQAQKTAKAASSVRKELEDRGILAFVMMADSLPEAEQRLAMRDVDSTIDDVLSRHMPGDEGAKARLVSNIFKQFESAQYSRDPRWIEARYPGVDQDGNPFEVGDRVFYYPLSRTFLTGEAAEKAAREFAAAAQDEAFMNNASVKVAEDKMPMKDGKPAFLSDDEDSDEDDEDSNDDDSDDEDDDKKSRSDDDEDSEDDDDDSDKDDDDPKGSKKSNRVTLSEGTIDPRLKGIWFEDSTNDSSINNSSKENVNKIESQTVLASYDDDEESEEDSRRLRHKNGPFALCPTCRGRGTHVNPNIDGGGLTSDDFADDPDFYDDYFAGNYDVSCSECDGRRVVPRCLTPECSNPAAAKSTPFTGDRDRRLTVTREHYPNCSEHFSEEDAEAEESAYRDRELRRAESPYNEWY